MTPHKRQINFQVSDLVYEKMIAAAKQRGYSSVSAFAQVLFEAAYAARVGKSGDPDLDTTVGCTMILFGAGGKDSLAIAKTLRVPEATVVRIIKAWNEYRRAA